MLSFHWAPEIECYLREKSLQINRNDPQGHQWKNNLSQFLLNFSEKNARDFIYLEKKFPGLACLFIF